MGLNKNKILIGVIFMGDLIKLMDELLKDLPEVNQMIEEDNKWID